MNTTLFYTCKTKTFWDAYAKFRVSDGSIDYPGRVRFLAFQRLLDKPAYYYNEGSELPELGIFLMTEFLCHTGNRQYQIQAQQIIDQIIKTYEHLRTSS